MKIKDKVLIVEDEQSISNFISMILQASDFDTIVVRTGEEALTMISSHCPDLIVLDLGLPDMDGMEVLKSVRKWSNLPVVVVSARNHEHDKVEALSSPSAPPSCWPASARPFAIPARPCPIAASPSPASLQPASLPSTTISTRCCSGARTPSSPSTSIRSSPSWASTPERC